MLPHPAIAIVIMRSCDSYVAAGCCMQNGELHSSNCTLCSVLRRSGGCMSRACCVSASSRRCGAYRFAACIWGGLVAARACLLCLFLLFVFLCLGPVLFCSVCPLSVLPALSLFFLSLSLSLSLPLSLSPCLSSGNDTNLFKRNAWTQTLERWTNFLWL